MSQKSFKEIEEIVFTYNGSAASVFAIKQFTYLFPNLQDVIQSILQVNDKPWTEKEKNNFKGWLENHYSAIGFEVLALGPAAALCNWIQQRENAMVVSGVLIEFVKFLSSFEDPPQKVDQKTEWTNLHYPLFNHRKVNFRN